MITISPEDEAIEVARGGESARHRLSPRDLSFSPDGARLAFATFKTGAFTNYHRMVLDGKEGDELGLLLKAVWSTDSRRFAYLAMGRMAWSPHLVVVDGVKREVETTVGAGLAFFDAKGRFCYAAKRDGAWLLLQGSEERKLGSREEAAAELLALRRASGAR